AHSFEERQLAAAALMVEAATMDSAFDAAERARIGELIRERFALGADEAADLIAEAERAVAASVQWHGFTSAIKDGYDHAERVELIEMLWEVAYADGRLHDYEASLLRRIAGLLYVSDRDSGEARKRVRARLGLP
ncbi:MAG: TerB family tellurite resistance protein, partial [Geminicoccaceae bacterium]